MKPGIIEATQEFENWLSRQLPIIRQDLRLKHQHMAEAAFPFFRATFYRWLQLWPAVCHDLANTQKVLAVGDLHIENFGTWRDLEGRLIWGVNDLDEVFPASYALDLVRLTTSAHLAIQEEHLCMPRREASEAIEEGYRDALSAGGRAFILAEDHQWLRLMALSKLRDPVHFWAKMKALPPFTAKPPAEVRDLLEESLPPKSAYQLKKRIAGLGSLGHPRILALSSAEGALLAREAKAIRPSAWVWHKKLTSSVLYGAKLASCCLRVPDPFVHFHSRWLVRRLAPDCSRIELASLSKERDEARLLYSMGWETANMHFGSPQAIPEIKRDLARKRARWLHKAAKAMVKVTLKDWEAWRRGWKKLSK
ncbi:MAG TPA: DUF2252 family protein [Candidatus Acidoferrum sp.]|nr:DUF2252 family protein [Candidatus Acidoferrum sp.]